MPRAALTLRDKVIDDRGNIFELVIWRVAVTPRSPSGVRYRLAFVRHGEATPTVLYDNHPPKGHHRHVGGVEGPPTWSGSRERLDGQNVDDPDQVSR